MSNKVETTADILYTASDPVFRLQAFKEYSVRAQERFEAAINAITEVVDLATEVDDDGNVLPFSVDSVMARYELSNSTICVGDKYVNLKELLTSIKTTMADEDTNAFTDFICPTINRFGFSKGNQSFNLTEVASQLSSSLHSATAITSAIQAYEDAIGGVSDVVTSFNANIERVWDKANDDISGVAGYALDIVKQTTDPTQVINSILNLTGIADEAAESDDQANDSWNPSLSAMSQYTGSSPCAVYDFSTLQKGAETVVQVAAKVVAGIGSVLLDFTGSLFKKAAKATSEVFVDPFDINLVNKEGFNTVNGFRYQVTDNRDVRLDDFTGDHGLSMTMAIDTLKSKANKWIAFKLLFSEIMLKYESVQELGQYGVGAQFSGVCIQIKPRVLNLSALKTIEPVVPPSQGMTYQQFFDSIVDKLKDVLRLGSKLYDVMDQSETDAYMSLAYAMQWTRQVLAFGSTELATKIDDRSSLIYSTGWKFDPNDSRYYNTPSEGVTNKDWISAFSGFNWSTGIYDRYVPSSSDDNYQGSWVNSIATSLLRCWSFSVIYEDQKPLDQAPFVPYSNDKTDFNPASFDVKTDDENNQAFTIALTAIVVVTVATVATIVIGTLAKKIALRAFAKRSAALGQMNAKMSNGQLLTNKEMRKYKRYKKKNDATSLFSSGRSGSKKTQSEQADDGFIASRFDSLLVRKKKD